MRRNQDRIAWAVMLAAFFVCCALTVGVPYGAWLYANNATLPPEMVVSSAQGTVLIERSPGQPPLAVTTSTSTTLASEGDRITTQANTQGEIIIAYPGNGPLAYVRLYEDTQLTIARLAAPRYSLSPNPNDLSFILAHGALRVQVPEDQPRPTRLQVTTPFGGAMLSGTGSYLIETDESSAQVSVSQGSVDIQCSADRIIIQPDQEGVLSGAGCSRVEGAARGRNVVRDGNFAAPLQNIWSVNADTTPGFALGTVDLLNTDGQPAVRFLRGADNWGKTGIEQTLDVNIRDKRTVRLHLEGRIDYQKLDVCGSQGTECPIMVKIEFEDRDGRRRAWLQGFYIDNDPAIVTPLGCPPSCEEVYGPSWLRFVSFRWEIYDSPNLIEEMQAAGFTPTTITSIAIYASGHSYTSYVRDVQLLVQD